MRTRSAGRNLFSRNTVLSFIGVVSFLILSLLGTHLHGADPVAQISLTQTSPVEVSGAATTPALERPTPSTSEAAAPAAAAPHIDVGSKLHVFQGVVNLEIITACMLALIMTLVLVTFSLRHSRIAMRAGTVAVPLPASWLLLEPKRSLFLLHSISRT